MKIVFDNDYEKLEVSEFRSSDKNKYCLMFDQSSFNNVASVIDAHWHEWLEIVYIIDGKMRFESPVGNFEVEKGEVVVCGMQTLHKIIGHVGQYRFQCLHINIGFIIQHMPTSLLMDKVFKIKDKERFLKYFSSAIALIKHDDVYSQLNYKANLLRMLGMCIEEADVRDDKPINEEYSDVFSRIVFYVNTHSQENISLQELSERFGYTTQHISLMFKKNLGTNYHAYLMKNRLDKARFLLETSSKKIIDIAFECGFPSEHSLINQFKKFYDTTPSKYRNSIKNK